MNSTTHFIPTDAACAGRSMQVLTMLQQLFNLNKKADDLRRAQLIQIQ
ncbi:MAG: hypothetical protein AAF513_02770 [Pseudomonadota bacterium]